MTRLPALGPRGEGWVLVQGILLVLVAAAGWSLGPDWSGPLRSAGIVLGVVMIATGFGLVVRAVADLGDGMTPLPKPPDDARLVDRGAFALVRHPIYSGLVVAGLGWAILRASVMAVALVLVLAAFLYLKSAREEAWLDARLPGYAAYRARTPRFIPRFGRSRG